MTDRPWLALQADARAIPLASSSVDAIVTDPPYGLAFMGRAWDHAVPGPEYWREALRVARPGAHLLAFGGSRTWHRLAAAVEDAGWKIRDSLMWLYGSGLPKSHGLGRAVDHELGEGGSEWEGFGTALKPGWEPVLLAMKPVDGTFAQNAIEHGVAGLNIDGCRIGTSGGGTHRNNRDENGKCLGHDNAGLSTSGQTVHGPNTGGGRWPANVVLSHTRWCAVDEEAETADCPPCCPVRQLDEASGVVGGGFGVRGGGGAVYGGGEGYAGTLSETGQRVGYGDEGGASRFFYCPKAARPEREAGLEGLQRRRTRFHAGQFAALDGRADRVRRNHHPTVKPLDLMRWLVRLVSRPGHLVLDLFMGSGSTGCAALLEDRRFVGLDLEPEYAELAEARLRYWLPKQRDLFGRENGPEVHVGGGRA
jgi:site-specific DNA-methyltransferase (adenine-specific)